MNSTDFSFTDLMAAFRENDRQLKEYRNTLREQGVEFNKKLEIQRIEEAKRSAEFDRKLEAQRIEADHRAAEADRRAAEAARRSAELDRQIAALTEQVTGISKSNGLFAEDYFFNSFNRDELNFFGEKFDRAISGKGKVVNDEYDFVLINGKTAGIVEVKYRARNDDIEKALKKPDTFRINFPEFRYHRIYLAIAAFSMDENLERKIKSLGMAVIKQEGDKVIVYNKNLKEF
jgi:hypothetical protein